MKNKSEKIDIIASFAAAFVLLFLALLNPWLGAVFGFVYLLIDPLIKIFKKK